MPSDERFSTAPVKDCYWAECPSLTIADRNPTKKDPIASCYWYNKKKKIMWKGSLKKWERF